MTRKLHAAPNGNFYPRPGSRCLSEECETSVDAATSEGFHFSAPSFATTSRTDSDVDVLVEFEPSYRIGLMGFAGLELELTEILGRKVDLNTPQELSPYYRQEVLEEALVLYDKT